MDFYTQLRARRAEPRDFGPNGYVPEDGTAWQAHKHKRNIIGSQLLLRRLVRSHYAEAPDRVKDRFLPVPFRNVLVVEYLKQPKPKPENCGPPLNVKAVIDLADAMKEVRLAMLHYNRVPVRMIVAIVGRYFGLKPTEIVGNVRQAKIVRARQITYYLCRDIGGYTMPDIGKRLGGKDHTSVLHGSRKIIRLLETDETLRVQVETLRTMILTKFDAVQKIVEAEAT